MSLDDVLKNLMSEEEKLADAAAAALYSEGLEILRKSIRRTPRATGATRRSGYVKPPREGASNPIAEVGYGTSYAEALHDRVEVFHAIGGPLYLSSAVNEARSGYTNRIGRRARRFYKQGIGLSGVPKSAPDRPIV